MEATVQRPGDHTYYFIPQKDLELGRVIAEELEVVDMLVQVGVEMAWLLQGNLMVHYLLQWIMEVLGAMETIMVSEFECSVSAYLPELPFVSLRWFDGIAVPCEFCLCCKERVSCF